MKIYAMKNGKGGCDKTTATINIATVVAEYYKEKILVIDSDGRGLTTKMFLKGQPYEKPLGSVLYGECNIQDAIIHTPYPNIDLIPCGEEIESYMKDLEKKVFMSPMTRLSTILKEVKELQAYTKCFIDCSQNADLMAVNTLLAADEILVPARSDESSKDGVVKILEWIEQANTGRADPLTYRVMITDRERNKEGDVAIEKIHALVGDQLCKTTIRHQAKPVLRSYNEKVLKPFVLEPRLSNIALDYIELVKELFYENI